MTSLKLLLAEHLLYWAICLLPVNDATRPLLIAIRNYAKEARS